MECRNYEVIKAFAPRFQIKAEKVRQCVTASLECTGHEALRVKPKFRWKSQDVGDTGSVEDLPRKAIGNRYGWTKRTHGTASGRDTAGLLKPVRTSNTL